MAVMEREPAKVQVGSQGSSWLVHHCQLFVEHLQGMAGKVVCSIPARLEEKLLSSAVSCPCFFLTAKSWLFNDGDHDGLRFMQFRLSLQFPNFVTLTAYHRPTDIHSFISHHECMFIWLESHKFDLRASSSLFFHGLLNCCQTLLEFFHGLREDMLIVVDYSL